jgi:RNA polymerase subunit RPABC4/transcription elongation factor Spt4
MAEFDRGNLHAQTIGKADKLAVQIATRWGSQSGGETAMTVSIQTAPDGVMVEIGQQAWLGLAASLGKTAFSALRNPFSLLGRLDDLAQDIENLQLQERVWKTIDRAAVTLGASRELSERFQRVVCEYCKTANPLGEGSCIACGAPLGDVQPTTCPNCGFVVSNHEAACPNCQRKL